MGNNNTRPRICQVAPSHCQPMANEPSLFPSSSRIITAVKGAEMQEKGIVGQRKTNHLPPLTGKHKIPNSVHLKPGQGVERWACPLLFQSHPGKALWYEQNTTGTHERSPAGTDDAQSPSNQEAASSAEVLWGKLRETEEVKGDEMGGQRVRLVSRPMQQNIFWDESEGQILDVRELLQPSPQLTDPNMVDTMSDKPLMENEILPEVEDQKCRSLGKECCHKNSLNSPNSRTDLYSDLKETVQRSCNANVKLP